MRKCLSLSFVVFTLFVPLLLRSQRIVQLAENPGISLRGLSVPDERTVWVSGSQGTVGLSRDGGRTWTWIRVPGHEGREFRDVEAFDVKRALIMASGHPAVILMTEDGGQSWRTVFFSDKPGMFLNAMDFDGDLNGVVLGDPVEGRFFLAHTRDGGYNWRELRPRQQPLADTGEICFAASGTNIRLQGGRTARFVTGGGRVRIWLRNKFVPLGLLKSGETSGANALADAGFWNHPERIVVVGGDFRRPHLKQGNCTLSRDGGRSWIMPHSPPNGYRSGVEFLDENTVIACGLNGVDISLDGGVQWNAVSNTGFHVCRRSGKGRGAFLAGEGKIARLEW